MQAKIILEKNFRCYFRRKYEALKELVPPLISAGIILLTCLFFLYFLYSTFFNLIDKKSKLFNKKIQ